MSPNPLILALVFLLGYIAGATTTLIIRAIERKPMPNVIRRVNRRDVVLTLSAIMAGAALIAAAAGVSKDRSQDRANIARNRATVECVQDTLDKLLGALPPVRKASAHRDEATDRRDVALNESAQAFGDLLVGLAAGTVNGPEDMIPLREALEELSRRSAQLDKAKLHLKRVRENNPYPTTSVKRCADLLEDSDATFIPLPSVSLASLTPSSSPPAVTGSPPAAEKPSRSAVATPRPSGTATPSHPPSPTPSPTPTELIEQLLDELEEVLP